MGRDPARDKAEEAGDPQIGDHDHHAEQQEMVSKSMAP